MEKLNIHGRLIGPGEPPYIVAEIGSNHNGDMTLCKQLIDAAKECGVDAVKFQSWTKNSLISKAEYERNTKYDTGGKPLPSLKEAVERYQLSAEQHHEIAQYCRERHLSFFSSVFSREEVDLLDSLDVPMFKIASMDVNYLPLLEYVSSKHRPVVMSTGLATLGEIEAALGILKESGAGPVILLHCVSIYPSPPEIVNLENISTLQRAFDVPVGYSDHTLGTSIPLASIVLGSCFIEKHFTLDKNMEGWDHALSADPGEMSYLVHESKAVFQSLGSAVRVINRAQREKRKAFRRRLVVTRALMKGQKLTLADIDFKRPGTGIRPDELAYVLQRTLVRDVRADDELDWSDLE